MHRIFLRGTLFLNPRNALRATSMYGLGLSPGDDASKATGIDAVLPRNDFKSMVDGFA